MEQNNTLVSENSMFFFTILVISESGGFLSDRLLRSVNRVSFVLFLFFIIQGIKKRVRYNQLFYGLH